MSDMTKIIKQYGVREGNMVIIDIIRREAQALPAFNFRPLQWSTMRPKPPAKLSQIQDPSTVREYGGAAGSSQKEKLSGNNANDREKILPVSTVAHLY